MDKTGSLFVCVAAALCGVGLVLHEDDPGSAGAAVGDASPVEQRWIGVTLPSARAAVGSAQAGIVAELPVREGQDVVAGDVLFKLDSRVEELDVQRLEFLAASDAKEREARADLVHAEETLRRLEQLDAKSIANPIELADAEHAVAIAKLQIEKAKIDREQALIEAARGRAKLEQRTLLSPLDGYVTRIDRQVGEPSERLEPVVEVVRLDPLWVEFDCPIEASAQFAVGADVIVRRAILGADDAAAATVVWSSRAADAASHTHRVRLELPNPNGWRAGLQVTIESGVATPAPSASGGGRGR